MRIHWLLVAVATVAGLGAHGAPTRSARPPTPRAAARTIAKSTPKVEPAPPAQTQQIVYPGDVTALRDLTYAALPGFRPLNLDLYLPRPGPKNYPRPTVIFVHGGLWRSGDLRHGAGGNDLPSALASLAARNYVVASIDYRLSGEARFPAPLQDVKSAIRWLRQHAGDYGIDTTRVAIWGEEAGGYLAAMAASSCGVAVLEPGDNGKISDCVEAAMVLDPISELASLAADSGRDATAPTPEGAFLGCEPSVCEPGMVRAAGPIAFIGPNSPPFLIQQTGRTVPAIQGQKLFDALNEAHIPAERRNVTTGDNGAEALAGIADFLVKTFPPAKPPANPPPPPKSTALPY